MTTNQRNSLYDIAKEMKNLLDKKEDICSGTNIHSRLSNILLDIDYAVDKGDDEYPWIDDIRLTIKELWNKENVNNSNPRVQAIKLMQSKLKEHHLEASITNADKFIKNYCL